MQEHRADEHDRGEAREPGQDRIACELVHVAEFVLLHDEEQRNDADCGCGGRCQSGNRRREHGGARLVDLFDRDVELRQELPQKGVHLGLGLQRAKQGHLLLSRDADDLRLQRGHPEGPGDERLPDAHGVHLPDPERAAIGREQPALDGDGVTDAVYPVVEVLQDDAGDRVRLRKDEHDEGQNDSPPVIVDELQDRVRQHGGSEQQLEGALGEETVHDDLRIGDVGERLYLQVLLHGHFLVEYRRAQLVAEGLRQILPEAELGLRHHRVDRRIHIEQQGSRPGQPVDQAAVDVDGCETGVLDPDVPCEDRAPGHMQLAVVKYVLRLPPDQGGDRGEQDSHQGGDGEGVHGPHRPRDYRREHEPEDQAPQSALEDDAGMGPHGIMHLGTSPSGCR